MSHASLSGWENIGNYMKTSEGEKSGKLFYDLAFGNDPYYRHQAFLCGRTTTDDNFTKFRKPVLVEGESKVPEGDFVASTKLDKYYVSVDPSGKLGWSDNYINYRDTKAHVLELLTEKATNDYKAMLRRKNISYIIVGKEDLDYNMAMKKLNEKFHIDNLMLGGGMV